MALSLKVSGVKCNANCEYCYQKKLRNKGKVRELDVDSVIDQVEREKDTFNSPPFLHGGEPLTIPKYKLDRILKYLYNEFDRTSIQTHGYLINDEHIEMFKKYNTSVGVSLDGKGEMNSLRGVAGKPGSEVTEQVMYNVKKLKDNDINVSILAVLHKKNALPEQREDLKDWILELDEIGINSGRLNLAVSQGQAEHVVLTEEEAVDIWGDLFDFTIKENSGMNWKPFRDIIDNLLGTKQGTCVFNDCMYYHADTESVILPDGTRANCLKTSMEHGHVYPRMEEMTGVSNDEKKYGGVRYKILNQIPYENGGCKGCKYWNNCLGGCPAAAIEGDWRNRNKYCKAYYKLFEKGEELLRGVFPRVTLSCDEEANLRSIKASSMEVNSLERLNKNKKRCGSTYKDSSREKKQCEIKKSPRGGENEHIDGNIRHLDSDA